jgi:cytidine deaminase
MVRLETRPELVVALVGPAGTDLNAASDAVSAALAPFGYRTIVIKLSRLMSEVKGGSTLGEIKLEDDRILTHMDAGDDIRNQSGRNDAMAGLAVGRISAQRQEISEDALPLTGTAFILDSLKHPDEVEAMRSIYRDRFVLISVHAPTESRRETLRKKVAASHDEPDKPEKFSKVVDNVMERDEHDDDHGFGQNVREAFVMGDIYVSTHPKGEMAVDIARYFHLFFGDPFLTPTRDEYAMFQTHTAALRSADLSRQVGAAVCTTEGEIVAVGCNEVPKANGGQYWPDDDPDDRDFELGYDSNVRYRDRALSEAFERLKSTGVLRDDAERDQFFASLKGSRLANLTEFGRTVHAEMAALLDAARRGSPVAGQKLFTTTFPCHNCARHIIAAGIDEVIYREPYEKSLASELHKDAIAVDPADLDDRIVFRRFVGVGPPRYLSLFEMRKRKNASGKKIDWSPETASPRLITTGTAYLTNEEDFLLGFSDVIRRVDLGNGGGNGDS